jgi:hypothetical protein
MAPPIQLTERKLQDLFNREVLPRIEAKELLEVVESDGPASPQYGQPPGARSQMVSYREVTGGKIGTKVAIAHRYMLPDGSLGGSGKPDPKSVKHDGELHVLKK